MFRFRLNTELGLSDSQDSMYQISFLRRRFNEMFRELYSSNEDCSLKLNACEKILKELHDLKQNVQNEANYLLELYIAAGDNERLRAFIPTWREKQLFVRYHFLNAAANHDSALELLELQEQFGFSYFTEDQMKNLIEVIIEKCTFDRDAERTLCLEYMKRYYLRQVRENPGILENYAKYLSELAASANYTSLAQQLSNCCQRGSNMGLFPAWQITFQGSRMFIIQHQNDSIISLEPFIDILMPNAIAFAYSNYKILKAEMIMLYDTSRLAACEAHLISCMENLATTRSVMTPQTFDALINITRYENGTLSARAHTALNSCATEQDVARVQAVNRQGM